jgi:hypothetical protein
VVSLLETLNRPTVNQFTLIDGNCLAIGAIDLQQNYLIIFIRDSGQGNRNFGN